jgi:hypothetical protein
VIEQVEEGVRVGQLVGERRQIRLHKNALAAFPATPLIVQEA